MDKQNDAITSVLEDIEKMRAVPRSIVEQYDEVKEGKISVDDVMKEPGHILYQGIVDGVVDFFKTDTVIECIRSIGKSADNSTAANIASILAVGFIHAIHQSIICYDDLIKEAIKEQLNPIIDAINKTTGEVQVQRAALEVFRGQLGDLVNKKKVEEFAKENGLHVESE